MHVIIVGCGKTGSELAKLLSQENHDVVVIDKDEASFGKLGESFNGITLTGNAYDTVLLKEAGIEKAEAFCATTNVDNANIMAAQVAKDMFKISKVIAKIHDPKKAYIYNKLGINVISGTVLLAAMIRDKIIGSHFTSYLIESGELGVIELKIKEKLAGKKVSEINIPEEFLIATILKKNGIVIPSF